MVLMEKSWSILDHVNLESCLNVEDFHVRIQNTCFIDINILILSYMKKFLHFYRKSMPRFGTFLQDTAAIFYGEIGLGCTFMQF